VSFAISTAVSLCLCFYGSCVKYANVHGMTNMGLLFLDEETQV